MYPELVEQTCKSQDDHEAVRVGREDHIYNNLIFRNRRNALTWLTLAY